MGVGKIGIRNQDLLNEYSYYICCARAIGKPFSHSIMKRAADKGLLTVTVHHLRKWAVNEYGMVDDYQFGGGAGMVMMCEPLVNAIEELNAIHHFDEIIYLTPDGKLLTRVWQTVYP